MFVSATLASMHLVEQYRDSWPNTPMCTTSPHTQQAMVVIVVVVVVVDDDDGQEEGGRPRLKNGRIIY
jgi:nitric oxide reductase large subunit